MIIKLFFSTFSKGVQFEKIHYGGNEKYGTNYCNFWKYSFCSRGFGIGVCVYNTVRRESKLLVMEEYSKIRDKYPSLNNASDEERRAYLKEMEFLCLGINNKIYDFDTLRKMSGKRLVSIYQDCFVNYISDSRKSYGNELNWIEYEKVMIKMSKYYINKEKTK